MSGRAVLLRAAVLAFAALVSGGCSSAPPTADAPSVDPTPKIFVEAMVFDVPSSSLGPAGGASLRFGDLAARSGARYVVSPHFLVANDVVTRMSRPTSFSTTPTAFDAAFASYRLDIKPHVVEPGRVRLEVDFDLADKQMKTTVEVDDKQLTFFATDVIVDDRRFLLVVRANIVRSDADLKAMLDERTAQHSPPEGSGQPTPP